jgi:hypothetical protein
VLITYKQTIILFSGIIWDPQKIIQEEHLRVYVQYEKITLILTENLPVPTES